MVFQRSGCSSYRCDGSFRKLCSATCISAFTTLPMVTALVPALCTLSATCLRFPRRCCFCVRSASCSQRVRVQNPEKKWGALGACHALNALNARIFFFAMCTKPERENLMMTSAGNPNRVALNRRASAPSTTTFSPRNRVFAIQNYGMACRLSCAPHNTEIGTKQRASGRGVDEEELQEEETRDYEGKRRPVMPRRRIWGSSSCSA
jgi:hypothetical protein